MGDDRQQIIDLETKFWTSMKEKDVPTAQAMIAEECLITGPMGTMKADPEKYAQMTKDGQWTLENFEFSDVNVIFPAEDVAVIAYKVHQTGQMKGKPMDMNCADSTTWTRSDGVWKCALHTETILQNERKLADA